jgi:hypothetical protein
MAPSKKIDKSAYKIIRSSEDLDDEVTYWLNKTPQQRIEAVEFLRYQFIKLQKLPIKMDKTFFTISYGK